MKQFIWLICASLLITSCKRRVDKQIEKGEERIAGTWNIDKVSYKITDTMGKILKDEVKLDQGELIFEIHELDDEKPLNTVVFTGPSQYSSLVADFTRNAYGKRTDNGWQLWWDADPEDKRLQFWAVNSSLTYQQPVNITYGGDGKSKQTFYYIKESIANNQREFFTWELSK